MFKLGLCAEKNWHRLRGYKYLGACPRIENLLRKSHFGPFFRSFSLNMSNYSPQRTKKMDSIWLPLATASILGQAPRSLFRQQRHLLSARNYRVLRSQENPLRIIPIRLCETGVQNCRYEKTRCLEYGLVPW